MSGHTPMPWTRREGNTSGQEVVAQRPRGGEYILARFAGKDREANAALFEAAPDLLAALKQAVDFANLANNYLAGQNLPAAATWLAAIRKAEGANAA